MEKTRTNIPSRRSEVEDLLRQRRNGCVQAFQTQRCSWRRIRRRARVQEARLIDDVDNEKTPFQNFKHQPICLQSNCKSILHFPAKPLFTVVIYAYNCDGYCCLKKQNPPFRHTLAWWKNSLNSQFRNTLHQQ
ncbi:hypothetical protein T03_3441 [Trichinella britovi]|uniref:Uncharacterized protein n=1 Tax=Trichinella britovi TaxID=45882 RepID=A0A0V1CL96_TRIBR|nr:hypothetical protein T03_3441 [Trichinella britovi]KRY50091.1 hypothetical protein T03_3441 [Trichinella britovi]